MSRAPKLSDNINTRYLNWFKQRGFSPFEYQIQTLEAFTKGLSGIINAPTGFGKSYSIWLPILSNLTTSQLQLTKTQVIWVTPVRALANDMQLALQRAIDDFGYTWKVAVRTGDTDAKSRADQKKNPPQCLITTPESLHLMLCNKGYSDLLGSISTVVVDEWHELLGSKRGVQVELALSKLRAISPSLQVWGLSATIGNLDQAKDVLLGLKNCPNGIVIQSNLKKSIDVVPVIPDSVDELPWGGHLGIKLLPHLLSILENSKTTLVFTNTRSQCEIWYQALLDAKPDLAGLIALHHGSLAHETRTWVEDALKNGILKVVVCTSSLDLGVDFRPVEQIIQIGGPKGVARFLQRAGRSGHSPHATSVIYFLPTQSLELIECSALKEAINEGKIEPKYPVIRAWDVLIQYLVTLAISEGFNASQVLQEIKDCYSYCTINQEEWQRVLTFITTGSEAVAAYDEFHRVKREEDQYYVASKRIAMRHRVTIGTIVQERTVPVKYLKGGYIGNVEEYFISKLRPNDVFSFGGKILRFVQMKDNAAYVKRAENASNLIPSWAGGRMPLSSQLSKLIREKLSVYQSGKELDIELKTIAPLLERQKKDSHLPDENEFLIEHFETDEGSHLFFYTFEGRFVNEGLSALISQRIGGVMAVTFSISITDYGFELLTDQKLRVEELLEQDLFSETNLLFDIQQSLNTAQLASKKFRDIAQISGLTFPGMPGKELKERHLQANSRLFFNVFLEYEPDNLLLRQSFDEVLHDQLEEVRLREALRRIRGQKIVLKHIKKPTPFCFSIMVERIRNQFTNESLEARVARMLRQLDR